MHNENTVVENEVAQLTKSPVITATVLKPKQKVLNTDTGETVDIEIVQTKYTAPSYNEKEYGGTPELFEAAVYEAARSLMPNKAAELQAFLTAATSASYQSGKLAAMAAGPYLGPDLKAKIVQVMKGNQAFADITASECFDRWLAGFKAKKSGAFDVLTKAKSLFGDFGDL